MQLLVSCILFYSNLNDAISSALLEMSEKAKREADNFWLICQRQPTTTKTIVEAENDGRLWLKLLDLLKMTVVGD